MTSAADIPPFVDAHVHVWDADVLRYPWLDDPSISQLFGRRYLPEDFAHDGRGLPRVASVHIQAEMDHAQDPAVETAWLAELSVGSGFPDACIGYADLREVALGAVLDRHLRHRIFRGIRQEAWYDPASTRADIPRENMLSDPRWAEGLRELEGRSLSFDLLIFAHQLAQARSIFSARPDLDVVLDHCAMPPLADAAAFVAWGRELSAFAAAVPRSRIKISGLAMLQPDWTAASVSGVVHRCIEAFGPQRTMLGSNFPVDRPGCTYAALWSAYSAMTSGYSASERDAMFRRTAIEFYRLPGCAA